MSKEDITSSFTNIKALINKKKTGGNGYCLTKRLISLQRGAVAIWAKDELNINQCLQYNQIDCTKRMLDATTNASVLIYHYCYTQACVSIKPNRVQHFQDGLAARLESRFETNNEI